MTIIERTLDALIYDHRFDSEKGACRCGWYTPDYTHVEHIAAVIREAGYVTLPEAALRIARQVCFDNEGHTLEQSVVRNSQVRGVIRIVVSCSVCHSTFTETKMAP